MRMINNDNQCWDSINDTVLKMTFFYRLLTKLNKSHEKDVNFQLHSINSADFQSNNNTIV